MVAKKGGVGKSTFSLLLYEALRQVGKSVAIQDWDPQGTTSKALRKMGEPLAKPGNDYDFLIYDTPPSLTHKATSFACRNADLILVITTPSPADTWEAEEAAQFALEENQDVVVRIAFNKVKIRTLLGKATEESGKRMSVPVLGKNVSSRECYQHAMALGWKALDRAAQHEAAEVALAIIATASQKKVV